MLAVYPTTKPDVAMIAVFRDFGRRGASIGYKRKLGLSSAHSSEDVLHGNKKLNRNEKAYST
jgi:hypothetical protein